MSETCPTCGHDMKARLRVRLLRWLPGGHRCPQSDGGENPSGYPSLCGCPDLFHVVGT